MMTPQDARRIAILAQRLARVQTISDATFCEVQEILTRNSDARLSQGPLSNLIGSSTGDPPLLWSRPIVDSAAMTLTWRGRSCRLQNKILFNLIDRLVRRPGHLVHYDRLLRDAWEGQTRTDEAIRNAVYRLKLRLREAHMSDLAAAIQSSGRRCGLMLESREG